MGFEIRHLQLVQAITEEGSVTRAGLRLHLSQSALSHQLRDAEERCGTRLFDRIGKRMRITPAGDRVLRLARSVLPELEQAERELRHDAAQQRGVVRLTTQCNTVYHWLPSRLKLYRRAWPDVDVQVVGGVTDDPLPALLEGRIDLAVVCQAGRDPRLMIRPLFRDEIVVVLPPGHRLAARQFVAAADFADESLIVYSMPRETNLVFREVLIPAGVQPARLTHIQLTEAILEMVGAGLGISVLPRWTIAPRVDAGSLLARQLTSAGRFRQWSVAYRRRPAPAGYLAAFADVLARHPLPLGRTAAERQRLHAAIVDPSPRRRSA